jgi:hypothetical protein
MIGVPLGRADAAFGSLPTLQMRRICPRAIAIALRIAGAVFGVCCVLTVAACDPCSGILGCSNGRYLSASGQIVDEATGKGIDGVRVDVIRTGGIAVAHDSLTDVSHDGGFWRVELSPDSSGTLLADVEVTPPFAPPYRLREVHLETRSNRGDANLNQRWLTYLYFIDVGEFFVEGTQDQRLVGATVEFRPTGGAVLSGPGLRDGVYRMVTDEIGRVYFFQGRGDAAVTVSEDRDVIGDLTVRPAGSATATTFTGVHIAPKHLFLDNETFPPVFREPVAVAPAP